MTQDQQATPRTGGNENLVWSSAGDTHTGTVRPVNEDAFIERPEIGLWGVADGMGGHKAGDVASQAIVDALQRFDDERPLAGRLDQIDDAMEAVNTHLLGLRDPNLSNGIVGSTVAILVIGERRLAGAMWAGDSRVYRLRGDELEQLSTDHSRVQEYVDQGLITPEQAATHPESHVITRALGSDDHQVLEADLYEVRPGDRFLLCTDGLTRHLSDADLARFLGHNSPNATCNAMLTLALERGGSDNTTAVVVDVAAAEDGSR